MSVGKHNGRANSEIGYCPISQEVTATRKQNVTDKIKIEHISRSTV